MNDDIGTWIGSVRHLFASRYVRLLEEDLVRQREEIARLRLENRALLNSLLGTAGVPPVEDPRPVPPPIAPIRRRSWPQIAAAREREADRHVSNR
jgi:hypothetical protein